jgi:hypothetical protein
MPLGFPWFPAGLAGFTEELLPWQKAGGICKAAFQKPRPVTIFMIIQWNFDFGMGFCRSPLSDRLH